MARAASAGRGGCVQSAPHIPIDAGHGLSLCSAYKFFGRTSASCGVANDRLAELPVYKVRPADDRPPFRWETGTAGFETIHGVRRHHYFAWIGSEFGADPRPSGGGPAAARHGSDQTPRRRWPAT